MPILVDGHDDNVEKTYACWPNRMYILDAEGKIADKGVAGPGGTADSAHRAPQVLERLLSGKQLGPANRVEHLLAVADE
jgi:hypothetical protein